MAEGIKYDEGKTRWDLWSPSALKATADVLAYGAGKYEEYNWTQGINYSRVFRACIGHLWDWFRGEDKDPESGQHHLAHAMCCLMFLLHYVFNQDQYTENDDRPWEQP